MHLRDAKLKEALKAPYSLQGNEAIYTYISKKNEDPDICPPVEVLVHAIRVILFPSPPLLDFTQQLLDLLGQVELVRLRAVEQARKALQYQQTIFSRGRMDIFTPAQMKMLSDTQNRGTARATFLTLCMQFLRNHIHQLRMSEKSVALPVTFRTLFPASSSPVIPIWFSLLNAEEREKIQMVKTGCFTFMQLASDWEIRREQYWRDRWPSISHVELYQDTEFFSYQSDFLRTFPIPHDLERLSSVTLRWAMRVQNLVEDFEALFDDTKPLISNSTGKRKAPNRRSDTSNPSPPRKRQRSDSVVAK